MYQLALMVIVKYLIVETSASTVDEGSPSTSSFIREV